MSIQAILFQASANYAKSFGSHNISALLVYERLTVRGDNFYAQRNVLFHWISYLPVVLPTSMVE